MMKLSKAMARAACAVGCAVGCVAAQAAGPWPSKPVKIEVGYAAGSSTDIVARLIAAKLGEAWKQTVYVENRGGAAGNLAADAVAKSSPDGYTILVAQNGLAISVAANARLPFNGEKDLVPVVPVAATPHLLIVSARSPITSVAELTAAAKASPGKLTYGSSGVGNSDHLAGEMYRVLADVNTIHIPYRGGSLAANDLIGGQIDFYFAGMPVGLPQVQGGRARALAVTGKTRFPALPQVPTMAEAGLPDYDVMLWQGIFVPAGTPAGVIAKIAADVNAILKTADMKDKMEQSGVQIMSSSQAEFDRYYRADIARWARIVKSADIKL